MSPQPDKDDRLEADGAVSIALVKPDRAPIVDSVKDGINWASAAIGAVNPRAGIVIQTVAVLGGWVWNYWKYDRARPALQAIVERLNRGEADYLQRDDFVDLLESSLRRISEQPEHSRRDSMRKILLKVIEEPQSHTTNNWFVRCADELDGTELALVHLGAQLGALTSQNPAMAWDRLSRETGKQRFELHEFVQHLCNEHIFDSEGVLGLMIPGSRPAAYRFRLTSKGEALVRYLRG